MPKIALITGINGQDGSYLSDLLLSKNYKVHGFVRSNFKSNNKKHNWRIKHLLNKITLHKIEFNNQNIEKIFQKKLNDWKLYIMENK